MPRDPVLGVWPRALLRAGRSAPRGASWLPQAAEFGKLLVPGPGLTPLGAALSRWRAGEDTQVRGGCCSNCAVCRGEKERNRSKQIYFCFLASGKQCTLFPWGISLQLSQTLGLLQGGHLQTTLPRACQLVVPHVPSWWLRGLVGPGDTV